MSADQPLIAIIDGNEPFRWELHRLLRPAGLTIELFNSAEGFLRRGEAASPHCVVLDVDLPGMSGLDLQTQHARTGRRTPLLFLTAQNEARACALAMKAGAFDYLVKPFQDEQLLDTVQRAIACDRLRRLQEQHLDKLRDRLASLSPRERETMALLSAGQGPKQIAGRLGVCTHTARVHASRTMSKMGAQSIADLVRMADTLGHVPIEREVHPAVMNLTKRRRAGYRDPDGQTRNHRLQAWCPEARVSRPRTRLRRFGGSETPEERASADRAAGWAEVKEALHSIRPSRE
jgi:FixJ family two-component response regulator